MTTESRPSPPLTVPFFFLTPCPFPASSFAFFGFFVLQRCSPRPPHHSLNLSIFCHGEKHLNLSLHLFITCHLRFLLLLPFLSPPLHLCVFPAARLLLFMPFASSVSIGLRSNANFFQSLIFIAIIFLLLLNANVPAVEKEKEEVLLMGGEVMRKHPSINN